MSQLQQAFDVVHDKNSFRLKGTVQDRTQFQQLFTLLLKTSIGRKILSEITFSPDLKKRGPVEMSFVHNSDDFLGMAFPDLRVELVQIRQAGMTKKQVNKVLLQQSMTLVHELTHVLQYLKRIDEKGYSFSPVNQVYANLLDEAEATLNERAYEIEVTKLYPTLTAHMSLWRWSLRRRKDVIKAFFNGRIGWSVIGSIVDSSIQYIINNAHTVLPNRKEKQAFIDWVNRRFTSEMQVVLSYHDLLVQKILDLKNPDYTKVKGNKNVMILDKKGRVVCLYDGDERAFTVVEGVPQKTAQYLQRDVFPLFPHSAFIHRRLREKNFRVCKDTLMHLRRS